LIFQNNRENPIGPWFNWQWVDEEKYQKIHGGWTWAKSWSWIVGSGLVV
jgi:hypothetical protein